jgi:hypothetical protein
MYEQDILLDNDGKSVVRDGDFRLTEDDRPFIRLMLLTAPGSWKTDLTLGVGLSDYVGMLAIPSTLKDMRFRITSFFKRFGMYPTMNLYFLDQETMIANIDFTMITGKKSDVGFSFDMTSSIVTFNEETDPITDVLVTAVKNKYLRRLT